MKLLLANFHLDKDHKLSTSLAPQQAPLSVHDVRASLGTPQGHCWRKD